MAQRALKAAQAATAARVERLDKKHVWHPFTQHSLWDKMPALAVASGRGAYLTDTRGRRYLDGVSSLWVNLHGHRHPRLDRAFRRQLGKIAHSTFLGLTHEPGAVLAQELSKVAPKGLTRTFYSDSGASAVEVALKIAFQYWIEATGRTRTTFLALRRSYHGDTLGAVSVGSISAFHSKFRPLFPRHEFAQAPGCFRCPYNKGPVRHRARLGEMVSAVPEPGDINPETKCRWECLGDAQKKLNAGKDRIAAAIIEPIVQGASGMHVFPHGYLAGFARLCRQANVLLIADEVATGFGRTGRLFACEQENVRPDILCLAKSITGGMTPLAATMTTEKIFQAFKAPFREGRTFLHGHSYTAHPLGAAVAIENLKIIRDEKTVETIRRKARILRDELASLADHPHVGSIRQAGMMVGVELVARRDGSVPMPTARRTGASVCQRLLADGIWLRPLGDVIVLLPPAVTSDADLRRLVRRLRVAIDHEFKPS